MNGMDNTLGWHNYVLDEQIMHADGKNEQRRRDQKDIHDPFKLDGRLRVFAACRSKVENNADGPCGHEECSQRSDEGKEDLDQNNLLLSITFFRRADILERICLYRPSFFF